MDVVGNILGNKKKQKERLWEEIDENIEYAKEHGYDYTKTDEYKSKRRQLDELNYR